MIYTNKQTLDYPKDASLTELLLDYNLNNTPEDRPAIIDGISGEVVFTYASFRHGVRKLGRHFQSVLGMKPGDVVGILSTNRNFYPVCVHAILATGAVVSALNPLYEPNELSHALGLSRPNHVLVEEALLHNITEAIHMTSSLPHRPALHVWDANLTKSDLTFSLDVEHILQHGSAVFEPRRLPPGAASETPAFICFSSGTSGLVKGVRLSHGNVVANIFQQSEGLSGMFTPKTVVALIVPFFHILGLAGFSCQYVCQGTPIVAFKKFDIGPLFKAVKRHQITHINVVPPIALEFLRYPLAAQDDLSSVQCLMNAAAPLNQRQADELSNKFNCAVTQWYGMTEASPSVASQREDEICVQGTIGRLLPGIEMRVLDDHGNDATVGEFVIRGPNIMQGYVSNGKIDSPMTVDGFMRTGDIGHVDQEGYLFIVDRAKEMIKVKGQQVAPAELESILITHPLVDDAAVCGIYDENGTSEMPVAYITTSVVDLQEQAGLKDGVLAYVNSKVARYKRITGGVFILTAIPRNPAGKILRRLLPAASARRSTHPLPEIQGRSKL